MKTPSLLVLAGLAVLLAPRAAWAHDALQSSTEIWLRPDKIEVEITMSRVPSRELLDNAPPVPVTDDDYDATYHALFLKCVPSLLEITLDGEPLKPVSVAADLFEETDIQFTLIYPRPSQGQLSVTASFLKKMEDGYVNTLGVNDDKKTIGYANQRADDPAWKFNLAPEAGVKPPSGPPSPPSPALAAKPPLLGPINVGPHDSYFVISHFHLVVLGGVLVVIIFLAIWFIRQKSQS